MSPEIRAFLASDIRSIIHIDALLANLKDIRNRCHERAVNHMNAIYSRRERLYDNNTPFGELSSEGPALDAMVDDANTYLSLIRGNLVHRLRIYRIEIPRDRDGWMRLERQLNQPEIT